MKKIITLLVLLVIAGAVVFFVMRQENPSPELAAYKAELEETWAKLDALAQEIRELKEQVENTAENMSDDVAAAKALLEQKQAEFNALLEEYEILAQAYNALAEGLDTAKEYIAAAIG